LYRGTDMFIVGSGNAAGQAAVYMARYARHVTLLVRADSLVHTASHYLIQELEAVSNLTVRYRTEVASAEGSDRLEALGLRDLNTGEDTRVPADGLAILIGQRPQTDWADGLLARDGQGFLLTGPDLAPAAAPPVAGPGRSSAAAGGVWPLARAPLFLETS